MEICQTSNCDHSPIAICLHCEQFLCVEHLLQHNEKLICEANIYCDEFNQLTEQIENMSFDDQFTSAEADLNNWLNDQMKELDRIYKEKLFELKQTDLKVKKFQQNQQKKIAEARRLFNAKLNKQITLEQLNRMKTTVEQFRDDIQRFQVNHCSINNDENIKQSQLNADAKPFEYNPKEQNSNTVSSIRWIN